jgi:hypothetical protein
MITIYSCGNHHEVFDNGKLVGDLSLCNPLNPSYKFVPEWHIQTTLEADDLMVIVNYLNKLNKK